MTLYADAHADQRTLEPIPLLDGKMYQAASCWDDLLAALSLARYFIYITGAQAAARKCFRVSGFASVFVAFGASAGRLCVYEKCSAVLSVAGWSIWTKLKLVRDSQSSTGGVALTLGQLLLRKANEGVRVLVLQCARAAPVARRSVGSALSTHSRRSFDPVCAQGTTGPANVCQCCSASRPRWARLHSMLSADTVRSVLM